MASSPSSTVDTIRPSDNGFDSLTVRSFDRHHKPSSGKQAGCLEGHVTPRTCWIVNHGANAAQDRIGCSWRPFNRLSPYLLVTGDATADLRAPDPLARSGWGLSPQTDSRHRCSRSSAYRQSYGQYVSTPPVRQVPAGGFVLVEDTHGKGHISPHSAVGQIVIWSTLVNGLDCRPSSPLVASAIDTSSGDDLDRHLSTAPSVRSHPNIRLCSTNDGDHVQRRNLSVRVGKGWGVFD
jgi:hypothetical protein